MSFGCVDMAVKSFSSRRILITGITSIHGWPIFNKVLSLVPEGNVFGIRPPNMSLPDGKNVSSVCMTDAGTLTKIRDSFRPTHVIHAAGVCDLDMCEERPGFAHDINVRGARNVTDVFGGTCAIMYLSADLVFSGHTPPSDGYAESDEPDPVSVVGKTYVLAEREIMRSPQWSIIRLGLPMGPSIQGEKGAVDFIEGRLKRNLPMSLFHDEWRSCIGCEDLTDILIELLARNSRGLYHCGGPDPVSLYEIGKRILKKGDYNATSLKTWSRHDDAKGPPRIGNVHLNSRKIESLIGRKIKEWIL
jgi:dTDP-4-dehydrorhamnose reductase